MATNEQLIKAFYTSFQNKDYKGMQDCYAENAEFHDEIFKNLDSREVKAMWEMLCKSGKEMSLNFRNITANDIGGTAEWTASYLFSKTGKHVFNHVKADFIIENNKITNHTDTFDFYIWAKQAFGFTGFLLGRTSFFKNKIQSTAMENLNNFMTKK